MPKQLNDIVFILKTDNTEELRYSLRSVEKNFPHRKVWFVGTMPEGFKPDKEIPHTQTGADKWERIRSSMLRVVQEPELTSEFFLFNDDFFAMKTVKGKFTNYVDRTLDDRLEELRQENPWLNAYGRTVRKANEELKMHGYPTMNFEVHMPMLFNKDRVTETILTCSSPQMRSIYGNVTGIPYKQHTDVKVYDLQTVPEDADYLSTNDETFHKGKVGQFIREKFQEPSRFEVTPDAR